MLNYTTHLISCSNIDMHKGSAIPIIIYIFGFYIIFYCIYNNLQVLSTCNAGRIICTNICNFYMFHFILVIYLNNYAIVVYGTTFVASKK